MSTAPDDFRFAAMLRNRGQRDGVRVLGRKTVEPLAVAEGARVSPPR